MEDLDLVKPGARYAQQIKEYREEFLEDGGSMDGCGSLRKLDDPNEWLRQVEMMSHKDSVPDDLVLMTQFLGVRKTDGILVGMIQVRHYFNEFLERYGGNIGYSVRPSERGKGYASRMLEECLEYCKKLGMERVLITCLEENERSRRTILKCGGIYESTVFEPEKQLSLERYWIQL